MRICVVGSCGKRKATSSPQSPTCKDIPSKEALVKWQKKLKHLCRPARDLYVGSQPTELTKGVSLLRQADGVSVDYYIISAGFGFLREDELVPPYECSFAGMSKSRIVSRADALSIPNDFEKVVRTGYDILYLALGKNYLTSLGTSWVDLLNGTVVILFGATCPSDNIISLPSDNAIVRRFSQSGYKIHGAVGFKGDLFRILASSVMSCSDPHSELMGWLEPTYFKQVFSDMTSARQTYLS